VNGEPISLREARLLVTDGIAELSHQRAQARNPLTAALREDYADAIAWLHGARNVRVLIITGSGGSFCAGGDVKDMYRRMHSDDPALNSPQAACRRIDAAQRWLMQLRTLEIPVIAAVDGVAYGAGFSLALQADFILASTRAAFCMSFARVGLVPDFGALHLLPRLIGLAKARELMMTARRVEAEEAVRLGFVHSVHSPHALPEAAHAFASRLAQGPPEALGITKRLLERSLDTDYATMAMLEASGQGIAMASPYHRDAVARFARGEAPTYDWDSPAQGE